MTGMRSIITFIWLYSGLSIVSSGAAFQQMKVYQLQQGSNSALGAVKEHDNNMNNNNVTDQDLARDVESVYSAEKPKVLRRDKIRLNNNRCKTAVSVKIKHRKPKKCFKRNENRAVLNENDIEDAKCDGEVPYAYHEKFAKYDARPALVLNADYQPLSHLPLSLWSWQDAVKAVFSGRVTIVDVYPDVSIRSVHVEVPLPSVIALNEYIPSASRKKPPFTRRNVFLRDGYHCQYCNKKFRAKDLTLDHVTPRCMGGRLTWDNAVSCCSKCNSKKGHKLPYELKHIGMKLQCQPRMPSMYELSIEASRLLPRKIHPTWEPYLGMMENRRGTAADVSSKKGLEREAVEE